MIEIYKYCPDNLHFNNEAFFSMYTYNKLITNQDALARVADFEGFDLLTKAGDTYLSKFNSYMTLKDISTGGKTYANVLCFPDEIFSIRECGPNAVHAIYSLDKGKIYDTFIHLDILHDKKFIGVAEAGCTGPMSIYDIKEWFYEDKSI